MKDQSQTSHLQTWKDLHSVTSLPELADGPLHSRWPESPTTFAYGPEALPASRSASQENKKDAATIATSHRLLCVSSRSAALQSFLATRLRQHLEHTGSTIYSLNWKEKVTPAGRQYCQRAASAPRTKETDSSSARTNWATPIVNDTTGSTHCYSGPDKKRYLKLPRQAKLADWGTPRCFAPATATIEAWEARNQRSKEKHGKGMGKPIELQAQMCIIDQPIRITASGQMLTGSDAVMESSGQLNPAHSRWLMGFPPAWDACAVMAMPSSRKLPPSSSERSFLRKKTCTCDGKAFYGYWLLVEGSCGGILTSREELERLREVMPLVERVQWSEYKKAKTLGWDVEWTENEEL